jgi:hypothetical protein
MSDSELHVDPVPLEWRVSKTLPADNIELLGVASRTTLSPISGTVRTEWLGRPVTMQVRVFRETEVATSVPRAKAYWIPAAWSDVAARLAMHGIVMQRIPEARDVDVEMYRLVDPKLATESFEGHVRLTTTTAIEKRKERYAAGSWRVPTAQPLGELATALLEPAAPDSFLQWGFFDEILQRTEYVENYVLEPLAEQMLSADPKLAEEFRRKLQTDESFRGSAEQRLRFFYERTPYYDERWKLYPVGRER